LERHNHIRVCLWRMPDGYLWAPGLQESSIVFSVKILKFQRDQDFTPFRLSWRGLLSAQRPRQLHQMSLLIYIYKVAKLFAVQKDK
jgi:hypothetical protein